MRGAPGPKRAAPDPPTAADLVGVWRIDVERTMKGDADYQAAPAEQQKAMVKMKKLRKRKIKKMKIKMLK